MGPLDTEVPFADTGGGVALLLQHLGEGGAVGFDEGRVVGGEEDAVFESGTPRVASGEEAIASGGADG